MNRSSTTRLSGAARAAAQLTAEEVIGACRCSGEDASFVHELALVGPPENASGRPGAITPPSPNEAAAMLRSLHIPSGDAAEVISTLPSPERAPQRWWCVERTARRIVTAMGNPAVEWGARPPFEGPADLFLERRCFLAHVFLAVMPYTKDWHRSQGIPREISRDTLADLNHHMAVHRRLYGTTGVEGGWWVTLSLRGDLFKLGRLQFERARFGSGHSSRWEADWRGAHPGPGLALGDNCLGIHIPEGGPLSHPAAGDALERAAGFFVTYFPGEYGPGQHVVATCSSWLLDPQLAEYLPDDSGIVSFQRRFTLVPGGPEGDEEIVKFVFRTFLTDPDALPQRTTLERAIVAHLKAGRHWQTRTGWLELPEAHAPG